MGRSAWRGDGNEGLPSSVPIDKVGGFVLGFAGLRLEIWRRTEIKWLYISISRSEANVWNETKQ